jgi:hypothetical protein
MHITLTVYQGCLVLGSVESSGSRIFTHLTNPEIVDC